MNPDTHHIELTDAQIERIAEKAAERALEKVYAEIGKSVAKKILWFIGVAVVGVVTLLASTGHIKI